MIPIVIYSHSDYSDLWVPFFSRLKKYYNTNKIYFIVNKNNEKILSDYEFFEINYDENEPYSNRLFNSLKLIEEEYIIFLHEDMILYNYVNVINLEECLEFLKNNSIFKFVRLIKSGINSNTKVSKFLYKTEKNDFLFSITPTIWKKECLIDACEKNKNLTIWELEENADIFFRNLNINGLYTFFDEKPRGGHFDSEIFPHTCSAIFKGKWNMEYELELNEIFKEFKIDKKIRNTIF
jgi:hypothetical protein